MKKKNYLKQLLMLAILLIVLPVSGLQAKAAASLQVVIQPGKKINLALISGSDRFITTKWTSSDKTVARVNSTGIVTGVKKGSATITAKSGSVKKTIKVRVAPAISKVTMSKSSISLKVGKTYTLKAYVSPSGCVGGVSWKSSKTSVATVSNGLVKAKKAGTATITCTVGTKSAKCTVKVTGSKSYVVSGQVTDALTGTPLSSASVKFRNGYNKKTGTVVKSTTSDSNGEYSVKLPEGKYTMQVSKSGYSSQYVNVESRKTTSTNTNREVVSVTPKVQGSGKWRFILTWGAEPRDLDSHLTGPNNYNGRFHTYFSSKYAYIGSNTVANLDIDDTTSYGPETTTLDLSVGLRGTYKYYVHDYTNKLSSDSNALARSGARVVVYKGNTQVASYRVPNKKGTKWYVFKIVNGKLKTVNQMSYATASSDFE